MKKSLKKQTKKICDLCFDEAEITFSITKDAKFHACLKHTATLSGIVYPIGNKLGEHKIPELLKRMHFG